MMRCLPSIIAFLISFVSLSQEVSNPDIFAPHNITNNNYSENSVLAVGDWYRLKVHDEGVYKIIYDDLVQQGIDVSAIIPQNIRMFGNGGAVLPEGNWEYNDDDLIENAIYVEGESDGTFDPGDYILFFGESAVKWKYDTVIYHYVHTNNVYSDYTYYFLNIGNIPGKRITLQPSVAGTADTVVTNFDDFQVHENDSVNLLKSGKEWYGEYFDATTSYSFAFDFPNAEIPSGAWIRTNIAARSLEQSSYKVSAGNNEMTVNVSAIPGTSNADYARYTENVMSFLPDGSDINITVEKMSADAIAWLNFIEVNIKRGLTFTAPQMQFRNTSNIGSGKVTEFRMSGVTTPLRIWDITDPREIREQENISSSSEIYFNSNTDTLKEFVAFDGSDFFSPEFVEKVFNQNLHGMQAPDMVILSYPLFISQAERIASIHENTDGFNVAIVTPQQIFNEFSSGSPDVTAIRNFMRMFYFRADSTKNYPKYLLLMGDASYDYKDRLSENTNFVPTYQSYNSLVPVSSYLTDDYFGILDTMEGFYSNGDLDIGIGRLPVKTETEANTVADKIEIYLTHISEYSETNGCNTYTAEMSGDWRNLTCYIADDEDNDMHIEQAENLTAIIDTSFHDYNVEKIYFDAYPQETGSQGASYPQVTDLINDRIQKGVLFINYTGHGGETGLAHEKVIQIADINSWTNLYSMTVFVTATCEFSRFDEPSRNSAGELVLLNPNGGGIALFTTTRVSFAYSNFNLNKSFCQEVFTKDSNNVYPRLGDIIRKSKIDNGSIVNIRNFVLLGDPALRMAYPENNVVTTEINGHPANTVTDTMKAFSKIIVRGTIENNNGEKLNDFNGVIYPTVYDKKTLHTTLANDPLSTPYDFLSFDKIIFKGKSSVVNGDFEFSFMVPQDISPDFGEARISYYAKDSLSDANGFYENPNFIIGGIDENSIADNEGPSINMFLNDSTFISGDIVDPNPVFTALLEDSSGIQYTCYGLGHDIVATLDGNTGSEYIMNDYFFPETDSYQKGTVHFPFSSLTEGSHTLSLKAWDIFNNSSSAGIDFIVTKKPDLSLKNIYNYPNPFSESTCFYFEHNQPCCDLNVELYIYNVTGVLVKTIQQTLVSTGQKSSTLCWDGRNDSGTILSSGVYIYRLRVTAANGTWLESANRLIILNK
jgi:hypothetical protein